ncbi:MAG TPA: hypothetical protein DEP85_00930, partial [Holosporales bacterium]|nr:hypothetical protein [Holosporales bacterium]
VISITQGLKSIFRKAPALLKKLPANRNVSPEVQKGSGSPQTSQGPPVVTTIAKKSKESVKDGRAGKQRRLKELAKDVRLGSADRGWLKQEEKSIERKSSKMGRDGSLKPQKYIRVPPGKELAHKRGKAAKDGNSYEHSDLQDIDLHKLQHKHEGYK